MAALAAATGQVVSGVLRSAPAFTRYASPGVAFTVLLACTAAAALLLSPGPDRGLALLTPGGTALVGVGALILGGFSVGGTMWFGAASPPSFGFAGLGGEVAGLPGDLLIAAVLVTVAAACLRAPVSRRVLALLAIPVIPYAVLWQEKLAGDLFGSPNGGASTLIPTSVTMTLPAAADPGRPHRRRNLARPASGRRASPPGGLQDHLRGTPGRPARLKPTIVVVVAPATAVAGAATTTPLRGRPPVQLDKPGNRENSGRRLALTIPWRIRIKRSRQAPAYLAAAATFCYI